jgi:hypothetical protein
MSRKPPASFVIFNSGDDAENRFHSLEYFLKREASTFKAVSPEQDSSSFIDKNYGKHCLPQTLEEAEIAELQAKYQKLLDDHEHRDAWIKFVKVYTVRITIFIGMVVFLCLISKLELSGEIQGVKYSFKVASFHLSDSVLIALLTTTLANVLGMCFIGLKYYFPSSTSDKKPNDKT